MRNEKSALECHSEEPINYEYLLFSHFDFSFVFFNFPFPISYFPFYLHSQFNILLQLKVMIKSLSPHQFVVSPRFHYLPFFQDNDSLGNPQRGKSMGDENNCSALGRFASNFFE